MLFLLALAFLIIIGLEVPGLVKKKMWRELAAFSGLMLAGMALSTLQVLEIPVPNLNQPLETLFKPFVQWLMSE